MKPGFRNLFMKLLTRDRVVPIISARVAWLTFVITRSGFPSLPKFAISNSVLAKRFSLELEKLIYQIFFDASIPSQQVGNEPFGNLGCSSNTRTMAAFSIRRTVHSVMATDRRQP